MSTYAPGKLRIASETNRRRHMFVRDLVLPCRIGIYGREQAGPQPVRINLDLAVNDSAAADDSLDTVVCYDNLVERVRTLVGGPHVNLVETLAEDISRLCLEDARILTAWVRIEKLNAVTDASSVGVEIERNRPSTRKVINSS